MSSTSPSSSSPSANVASPPPDGASCWLCLEEGPDDSGAPLVRNCSCRGSSGFAHLSCVIEYAENMARQIIQCEQTNGRGVGVAFFNCPNCKQDYQDDLKDDMIKAFIAFNTVTLPENNRLNKYLLMETMRNRLRFLDASIETDRIEGEELVTKLLASIEEFNQSGMLSCLVIDALAYADIGGFYEDEASNESMNKAKSFYQKARDKYLMNGGKHNLDMKEMEIMIGRIESKIRGNNDDRYIAAQIKLYRDKYDCCVKQKSDDIDTINTGIKLANALSLAFCFIEAERLLGKMVTTSHRIHGPDHGCTVAAMSLLKRVKQRWVSLECEKGWYEALQHEDDGENCVLKVKGPIKEPRVVEEEQTFEVESALVAPCPTGTPVELFGLKKADHLNGMIGDARDYCFSTSRYVVYLEDKGWKPVKVKSANLRIVFELPDPENLD